MRAAKSRIQGSTGGRSNGLTPMLRVFDATARYVDQGGGKRKGAFAAYLEPWHADVRVFLDMKKNHGMDQARARDLFYALWIPDLFMKRVEAERRVDALLPGRVPRPRGPPTGDAFEARATARRTSAGAEGLAVATLKAQELWFAILDAQIETGTPYMLYKDACNAKSNQQQPGHHPLVQPVHRDRAVHLARRGGRVQPRVDRAAALRGRDRRVDGVFDHDRPRGARHARHAQPQPRHRPQRVPARGGARSNLRHRPVGIGVQGLADVFMRMLMLPFDFARRACSTATSSRPSTTRRWTPRATWRARRPYESYAGSPASQGKLQFDLWGSVDRVRGTPARVGLGGAQGARRRARAAQLAAARADADGVDGADPRQQRVLRSPSPATCTCAACSRASSWWSTSTSSRRWRKTCGHVDGGGASRPSSPATARCRTSRHSRPRASAVYQTAWKMSMRTIIDPGGRPRALRRPVAVAQPLRGRTDARRALVDALYRHLIQVETRA